MVNDLLSKRENTRIDRFKAGKDGGIDGRFFTASDNEVIIQSKHWPKSGVQALIKHMKKKELPKIILLNPKRYILATSLELSRENKKKIKNALSPYIKSENDILGQENLNDLLSQHKDIEQKHYKLWIASTTVLETILNHALTGRSETKREQIIENSKTYVITENHNKALEKLNETHTVIITGEAGIGKTTLADQLALYHIANGYELCVIAEDLSEAEDVFTKDKKKIFYFDDFLGRNYLMAIEGHKESRVLDFIERVGRDKTKRFILTSRSTVLTQGKLIADLLKIKRIEDKEHEVTIQSLSIYDKAQILYNHIWYGDLAEDYIDELYVDRRYLKIVKHRNYNPRLISFITDPIRLSDIQPELYWKYIEETLDDPKKIWAHVFDKQIDDLMRIAVCLVVFNGGSMKENDLKESFFERSFEDALITQSNANSQYAMMIEASVGSMLGRTIASEPKNAIINLFNPSVADFILSRFFNDYKSLTAYYSCLNSVSSLKNLESLHSSKKLGNSEYLKILCNLVKKKITPVFLEANPTYFIRLAKLILDNQKSISNDVVALVINIIEKVGFMPVHEEHIYDACSVLGDIAIHFQVSGNMNLIMFKFVKEASKKGLEHDDFIALNDFVGYRDYSDFTDKAQQDELRRHIKDGLVDCWSETIGEYVSEDYILDDFMRPDEIHLANDALYEYLEKKFGEFKLTHEEISNVMEYFDIEDKIHSNIDSTMYEDERLDEVNDAREHSGELNEDTMVDELFYRDK